MFVLKSMLMWLTRLCCHSYGTMNKLFPPGAYNGVGRALFKLLQFGPDNRTNNNNNNDEEEEGEE